MDKSADYIQQVSGWYDEVSDNGLHYFLVYRDKDENVRCRSIELTEDFYDILQDYQSRDGYDVLESYTTRIEVEPQLSSSRSWQMPPRNSVEDKLGPKALVLAKLVARLQGAYEDALKALRYEIPDVQKAKLSELRRLLANLQEAGVPECTLLQEIKLRIIDLSDTEKND